MQSLSFVAAFLASFLVIAVANSTSESTSPSPNSSKSTSPTSSITGSSELTNNDAPQQTETTIETVSPTRPSTNETSTTSPIPLIHESGSAATAQMSTNNVAQGGKVETANGAADATKDPKNPKKGSGAGSINSDLVLVGAVVLLVGGLFA